MSVIAPIDEDRAADQEAGNPDDELEEVSSERSGAPAWLLPLLCAFVGLGVVAGFFTVFALGLSGTQEQRNQAQLYATLRGLLDPSSTTAPFIGGHIPLGQPVALLNAPAGDLHNLVVVEGTTSDQMRDGPGHLPNSPLPGQVGDAVLIGRSTTTGAPFGRIDAFRRGDTITITTGQGRFVFRVVDVRRAGSHVPAIPPSGSLTTFVTSSGSGLLGNILHGHLIYVDAALQGTAVATPSHAPRTISQAEIQGHGDAGSLGWVALWFVALIATVLGSAWLIARWGWRRSWIILAPVALAVLWGLSDEMLQLVPNVF